MTEFIRKLLIKTILPLRKRKEKFLSQFRFSIAFRITLNYIKLFFLYGIVFLLLFAGLYLYEEGRGYNRDVNEYEKQMEQGLSEELIQTYHNKGLEIDIYDTKTNQSVFNNYTYDMSKSKFILDRIYYSTHNKDYILVIHRIDKLTVQNVDYIVTIQYNMTKEYNHMVQMLWKLAILYGVIAYIISKRGKKENVKLLDPINEMSAIANRLTVNNLGSERINVAGTKNELKDLAVLINKMLDRIDTSYESQKQFVSDASHELRTPIAVIQGYGNLLHRWGTKDEEVLKESVDAINHEAKSMQDLVEKLLFLSRHDKKTLKLDKKRFNMGPVIEEMVKETKLVAKNRIILSPVIDNVFVYGDEQALKQAIRIFIDNAIKYTEDGDSITITCKNHGGDCIICVADTGIGMKKKDMDHIFQRFYRSDEVRNKSISGHGLGLSLAKLIILAHVGRIKIRSQFTVGTSFKVILPKIN